MIHGDAQEVVMLWNNLVIVTVQVGTVVQVRHMYAQPVIRNVTLAPLKQTQVITQVVQAAVIVMIFIFQGHQMPIVSLVFLMGLPRASLLLLLGQLKYSR